MTFYQLTFDELSHRIFIKFFSSTEFAKDYAEQNHSKSYSSPLIWNGNVARNDNYFVYEITKIRLEK